MTEGQLSALDVCADNALEALVHERRFLLQQVWNLFITAERSIKKPGQWTAEDAVRRCADIARATIATSDPDGQQP